MAGYAIISSARTKPSRPTRPRCSAAGSSIAEVEALMREEIQCHLEFTAEHGDPIPPPTTVAKAS
jgi:predicted RNase H-like HicB family nuclease